jgi:hypothetical protein
MTETEPAPPPAEPAAPDPETTEPSSADPASNWTTALPRLWILREVPEIRPLPAVGVSWTLAALSLALWVAIDHWQIQPNPQFVPAGIVLLAWYGLAALALTALLGKFSRPRPPLAALCALVFGLVPPLLSLASLAAATLDDRWTWGTRVALALYAACYAARGLRALCGRSQPGAAALAGLFVAAFVWSSDALDAIPDVWTSPEATPAAAEAPGSADAESPHVDAEALLFDQPARIDAALARLRRDRGERSAAFFLGFAGVGSEPEFAGEIALAGRVFAAHYGAGERRLALVNDERNFDAPLATVSSLHYALRGMAARMRIDRDVLFLAISSHGAADGSVAVEDADLPLDALTPEDLAASLRDSGIKWRVIVVSACYSGAFVEPLRGPDTIVITAAAADRSSFGCSSDRDFTYFGEAFYRDALPQASSLRDAFAKARAAIAAREHREGMTPSEPQASFGSALESKLSAAVPFD